MMTLELAPPIEVFEELEAALLLSMPPITMKLDIGPKCTIGFRGFGIAHAFEFKPIGTSGLTRTATVSCGWWKVETPWPRAAKVIAVDTVVATVTFTR